MFLFIFVLLISQYPLQANKFLDVSSIDINLIKTTNGYHCKILLGVTSNQVLCEKCDSVSESIGKANERYVEIKGKGVLEVSVKLTNGLKVPFTTSCDGELMMLDNTIKKIAWQPFENHLQLYWQYLDKAKMYQIIYTDGTPSTQRFIKTVNNENQISIYNVSQKHRYQFCISPIVSINNYLLTSKSYSCITMKIGGKASIGPITQLTISNIKSSAMLVTWMPPLNSVVNEPNGYSLRYWRNQHFNECREIIMDLGLQFRPIDDLNCPTESVKDVSELEPIYLYSLEPYSLYHVQISPLKNRKLSIASVAKAKTLEGKSGPISDVNFKETSNNKLQITFKKPAKPNGNIRSYQFEYWIQDKTQCIEGDHEKSHIYKLEMIKNQSLSINYNICSVYTITITPINGWKEEQGKGEFYRADYTTDDKKTLFHVLELNFISSNLLRLYWKLKKAGSCGIVAIIFRLYKSQYDSCSYMYTRIINDKHKDCWASNIAENVYCDHKSTKFVNSLDSGLIAANWPHESVYIDMSIYGRDLVERTQSISTINQNITKNRDCYSDCYSRKNYHGIRSSDLQGNPCIMWSKADSYSVFMKSQGARANYCIKYGDTRAWCPNSNGYGYCNVPRCDKLEKITPCVPPISLSAKSTEINGKWEPVNDKAFNIYGYIINLHNSSEVCHRAIIQSSDYNLQDLEMTVSNVYNSCRIVHFFPVVNYQFKFTDLNNEALYYVFISPILNNASLGSIRRSSIETTPSDPRPPFNITITSFTKKEIAFSWPLATKNQKYSSASFYNAVLRNDDLDYSVKKTISETDNVIFDGLVECNRYCLFVQSVNNVGKSDFIGPTCAVTLSEFDQVTGRIQLHRITPGYATRKQVKWKDLDNSNCAKLYTIKYGEINKWKNQINFVNTTSTQTTLENLSPNLLYYIQISAALLIDETDEYGRIYSNEIKFYTGNEQVNIRKFNIFIDRRTYRDLLISWSIDELDRGALLAFLVIIIDDGNFKKCIGIIRYSRKQLIENSKQFMYTQYSHKKCGKITNYSANFSHYQQHFNIKFQSNSLLTSYTSVLYGSTVLGWKMLTKKTVVYNNEPIKIKNFKIFLSKMTHQDLKISWIIDKADRGIVSTYLFVVVDDTNLHNCMAVIRYTKSKLITTKNDHSINLVYSKYVHKTCPHITDYKTSMNPDQLYFKIQHKSNALITNYTLLLFGQDLIGWKLLKEQSEVFIETPMNIKKFRLSLDKRTHRDLEISWGFDEADRGLISTFLLVIIDDSQSLSWQRNPVYRRCAGVRKYSNTKMIKISTNSVLVKYPHETCQNVSDYKTQFSDDQQFFNLNFHSEVILTNYTLLLYGKKVIGWRLLKKQSETFVEVPITIKNLQLSLDKRTYRDLEINWSIDKIDRGITSTFLLVIVDDSQETTRQRNLVNRKCVGVIKYTNIKKKKVSTNYIRSKHPHQTCQQIKEYKSQFLIDQLYFNVLFHSKTLLTNYTLLLYGRNVIGWKLLTTRPEKFLNEPVHLKNFHVFLDKKTHHDIQISWNIAEIDLGVISKFLLVVIDDTNSGKCLGTITFSSTKQTIKSVDNSKEIIPSKYNHKYCPKLSENKYNFEPNQSNFELQFHSSTLLTNYTLLLYGKNAIGWKLLKDKPEVFIEEPIKIQNFKLSLDKRTYRDLQISWDINEKNRGSVSTFVLFIIDDSRRDIWFNSKNTKCIGATRYSSSKKIHDKSNRLDDLFSRKQILKSCEVISNYKAHYSDDQLYFNLKFHSTTILTNYTLLLYGRTIIGWKLLKDQAKVHIEKLINIKKFEFAVDRKTRQQLQINWSIDENDSGVISTFLLVIIDNSRINSYYNNANRITATKYSSDIVVNKEDTLDFLHTQYPTGQFLNLSHYKSHFSYSQSYFNIKIHSQRIITNYTLTLYGRSLLRWRLLKRQPQIYVEGEIILHNLTVTTNYNEIKMIWQLTDNKFGSKLVFVVTVYDIWKERCESMSLLKCKSCQLKIQDDLKNQFNCSYPTLKISNYQEHDAQYTSNILNSHYLSTGRYLITLYSRSIPNIKPFIFLGNITTDIFVAKSVMSFVSTNFVIIIINILLAVIFILGFSIIICKIRHRFSIYPESYSSRLSLDTKETIPLASINT